MAGEETLVKRYSPQPDNQADTLDREKIDVRLFFVLAFFIPLHVPL